ncbi:MAG: hypothetical protein LBR28_02555 [Bacteroidales bacterium]|jgi:cbb3-type cytochrome oxidase subunit 3|nr:hypothetical protein [Bacteroidales bacterium]
MKKTILTLVMNILLYGITNAQPIPTNRPGQGTGDNPDVTMNSGTATAFLIGLCVIYSTYRIHRNKKDR